MNRSPTSQTCHQHIWSLRSVTNIDVTDISTISLHIKNNKGILVGTLTTGSVADAIGRQKTLFYGQIIATIFFLLQLAVTDVIGLAVIRFCLGPLYLLIYG